MNDVTTPTTVDPDRSAAPPATKRLVVRRGRGARVGCPAPAASDRASSAAALRSVTDDLTLACQIVDELVATAGGSSAAPRRSAVLPVLHSIGVRNPRAAAAAVARDALNRTAEVSAGLPDTLADAILEDVVRTARLIDSTVDG